VDPNTLGWLRPVLWGGAIVLFILGGYSDAHFPEFIGWGLALLTAGFLVTHLRPGGNSES
jgi:hypothetical protein